MSQLAETQAAIAAALISGDTRLAPASLGGDSKARFGIHIRHYHASLRTALSEKFPATAWLLGGNLFASAAAAYVRERPPGAPCIAEYGSDFPEFIARLDPIAPMSYIESFARLEWALARASIAVDETAIGWHELAGIGPELLLDTAIRLQPGLSYLEATHPVDSLIRLFLSDREPDTFELPAKATLIEVGGSCGAFSIDRLDAETFTFRAALARGATIGEAAGDALDAAGDFDAGQALRELVDRGLVASTTIGGRRSDAR